MFGSTGLSSSPRAKYSIDDNTSLENYSKFRFLRVKNLQGSYLYKLFELFLKYNFLDIEQTKISETKSSSSEAQDMNLCVLIFICHVMRLVIKFHFFPVLFMP